ncbi:glycosyltransferase family 1 protein [Limibacter armeniacum]|uniref:glycosyltransferase family 4 protein n=1 Tax=Limibacter armeniacum TaxID=466084 RepID=UPI002FE649CF
MKIGFEAKRVFNNYTGLGNYCRTLLENIAELHHDEVESHLFTPRIQDNARTHHFLDSGDYHLHLPKGAFKTYWRTAGVVKDLQQEGIELFHGLSHELPVGIRKSGVKSVVTIHDLIFRHYPKQYNRMDNLIYDVKFKYACENADKVVAISECTKNDIIDFYGIDPAKIEVIYQTCDDSFRGEVASEQRAKAVYRYGLPTEFILYVGSIIPRKKLKAIVEALYTMPESERVPLVAIGAGGPYKDEILSFVQEHKLEKWVYFPEKVAFSDFPALYQQAQAFIYPSIYEGFGIPIIEALFSQTPVITSNLSCLPEAAGPDACYVDPYQPESVAEGIRKVVQEQSLRESMIEKGLAYVQRFDKAIVTAQMVNLYKEVLDS